MENSDSLIAIAGLNCSELTEVFDLKQKFRAKQIFKWIADGAKSFDEMTNLPEQMRKELSEKAVLRSSTITQKLVDPDGTVKLQLTLQDGSCVETVSSVSVCSSSPELVSSFTSLVISSA